MLNLHIAPFVCLNFQLEGVLNHMQYRPKRCRLNLLANGPVLTSTQADEFDASLKQVNVGLAKASKPAKVVTIITWDMVETITVIRSVCCILVLLYLLLCSCHFTSSPV